MAKIEKIRGIVLSRRNVGEADRLLRILSDQRGLIRVLAKGVRKIPSRRGSHTEPFRRVVALVAGNPGNYFLSAVETEEYYHGLHNNKEDLSRVNFLAKLMVSVLGEDESQVDIFEAFDEVCEIMQSLVSEKKSMLEISFSLLVLNKAGLSPLLDKCQRCGERRPKQAVVLESREGGWYCLGCCSNLAQAAASFSPDGLSVLRFLSKSPSKSLLLNSEGYGEQLVKIMRRYIVEQVSVRS
jgi:DNA repair protein RecO (recombination protein O)